MSSSSNHSVPVTFPQPLPSELNSEHQDFQGYGSEKPWVPLEGPLIGQRSGKFELSALLSKLRGPMGIVVCGQMILLITAWGFFSAVQTRGFIALPSSTALWVIAHTHLVTVIFTMISTGLSLCSSFLFSWGIRQSITLYLHGEGMSLAAFISSVKISSRSLILDARKGRWSAMSIAVFVLTVVQTSCWSALITPGQIDFEAPLTASELDLSNPRLQSLQSGGTLDYCVVNTSQTESGYAAVKSGIGFPASVTLMDQTFNLSTAGILPQTLYGVNASSWFTGSDATFIPTTLGSDIVLPEGLLSSSYSMTQQGFTADVTCEFQDLPADTTIASYAALQWENNIQPSVTLFEMTSTCVDPKVAVEGEIVAFLKLAANTECHTVSSSYAYTVDDPDPNYMLMVGCETASAYSLIFQGVGLYSFMQTAVCTLAPKITTVQVDYSDAGINTTQITEGDPIDVGGPAGLSALITIYEMQLFAQATSTNVVGDQLRALIEDADPAFQDATVLAALEEYIRGVTEYSGSVETFSSPNCRVPVDMAIPSEGFLHGEIVGWRKIPINTFYVMIPGTVVAIATIWVVLMTLVTHAGDPEGEPFDPANAMHIVAASAAGGLHNVFAGTDATALRRAEGVHVVLQSIAGQAPALHVRAGVV
ncbi:hypothetical protein B0H12DRAFT_1079372 [Mycena haematopus]|nr:hypothetical protein B0H12DRAFT_1079372 [Mycena haematopus]